MKYKTKKQKNIRVSAIINDNKENNQKVNEKVNKSKKIRHPLSGKSL